MPDLHQEVTFNAPAAKVYRALLDSAQHAAFTGAPAEISSAEGGAFSAHGGMVHGRNVALVPNARIVQAWRIKNWPEDVFSIARFELCEEGDKTRLVFDQEGAGAVGQHPAQEVFFEGDFRVVFHFGDAVRRFGFIKTCEQAA